jgi:hypothetical protein
MGFYGECPVLSVDTVFYDIIVCVAGYGWSKPKKNLELEEEYGSPSKGQ